MPKILSNALKPLQVKNLPPGRHTDGGGLQLLVKKSGSRSWVFRFMIDGNSRDIGLGPAIGSNAVSLAEVRDLATDLRRQVRSGVDPLSERARIEAEELAQQQAAANAGITFRDSAQTYIATHSDSWKNAKHRAQWSSTLEQYVYPVMGDLPVSDIATEHVMTVIEPIWNTKQETASRIRGRIEMVLDAAKARGHRKGENPARWRGHIALMLPARTKLSRGHHRAMPYSEVSEFMDRLRKKESLAAFALRFTILTAARSGETLGASWDEFDLDAALWTIPAHRMKAGREHRVPLSDDALSILSISKGKDHPIPFTGPRGGHLSNMAMAMLLRSMDVDATVHGFRSSFRDWAAEATNYAHEVCEMALAHTISNKSEAAYRRGDLFEKRRKLMEAWAEYCSKPNAFGNTVTPIRA